MKLFDLIIVLALVFLGLKVFAEKDQDIWVPSSGNSVTLGPNQPIPGLVVPKYSSSQPYVFDSLNPGMNNPILGRSSIPSIFTQYR